MSAAFAFEDEGLLVDGPSVARAFLHALVRKLHRLAVTAKETFTKALHGLRAVPRFVVDTIMTTVATVRARSGFGAAVSLVLTGGQVLAYALRALATRVNGFARVSVAGLRRAAASLPPFELPANLKAQARALSKNPWIAAAIVAIAVLAAGAVALVRWTHERADSVVSDVVDLTEEELERIMKGLFVVLGTDGAVHVHGIPVTIAETVRDGVARVASDAAMQRLESLVRKGRPLSTLDLQAINVAARSAVTRQFSQGTDTSQLMAQAV